MIPIPLSRGVFVFGPPLWVPKNLSPENTETYRKHLENLLSEVTREADTLTQ